MATPKLERVLKSLSLFFNILAVLLPLLLLFLFVIP